MSKRQQSKKRSGHKIRIPSQIAGGGLNRTAGVMHSDKEYKRPQEEIKLCSGCNEPWQDCTCDSLIDAVDWHYEYWDEDYEGGEVV